MIELQPCARIQFPTTPEQGVEMQKQCEYAARNCYNSTAKMTETSYQKMIPAQIKRGHESPIEHSLMIAEIVTGRDVMAEQTRHRLNSFSIRSQRYVDECGTGDVGFVVPHFERYGEEKAQVLYSLWKDDCLACEENYKYLKEAGAINEDARKVLINSTATQIIMSGNLRSWRHVFQLRTAKDVYPECRIVMCELLEKAKAMYPTVFDDINPDEEINNGNDQKS